jgi:hypothetical protein
VRPVAAMDWIVFMFAPFVSTRRRWAAFVAPA